MSIWNPSADIYSNASNFLQYEVTADGDAYLSVGSPWQVGESVLVRVSTQALSKTTHFFAAQFSDRWSQDRKCTSASPLVLAERFEEFVTFVHICHEDDMVPQAADRLLKKIGVFCDKYLFEGRLPTWCEKTLGSRLPLDFPSHRSTVISMNTLASTGSLDPYSLTSILESAYLLNLPAIFAKASRAMMWSMSYKEVEHLLPKYLVDLLPMDFVESFRQEALRLRKDLISNLPTVFYPDPHGESQWGCQKCSSVSHEERWNREIVRKNGAWLDEQRNGRFSNIGFLFEFFVDDMTRLDRLRELETEDRPFECGRFRLRYLDASPNEILWHVYQSVGSLCLLCVKSGEFKFGTAFCGKHNVNLSYN